MQTFDTVFSFSLRAFSAALEQDMLETTAWLYYRVLDRCCDHELLHYLSIKADLLRNLLQVPHFRNFHQANAWSTAQTQEQSRL